MDLGEIESRYMALFWEQQRCRWENYAAAAHHDLARIDEQVFALLSPLRDALQGRSRRARVLRAICKRACVDGHPEVSPLRHRLDDPDNYARNIQCCRETGRVGFGRLPAEGMREDVLELMRRRQSLARELGFASYPHLVLWSEGLELEQVRVLLTDRIRSNLPAAAALAKRQGIAWCSWEEGLASLGSRGPGADAESLVYALLRRLGLGRLAGAISIVVKEQPIAGYAGILRVPDDIRLLVRPMRGLEQELTLYHELGHAVAHALNQEVGIFQTWTSAYDEAMAVLLERIAALVMLHGARREAAQELMLLETTRCATSALYELALWEQPAADDELYRQHYGRWGIGAPPDGLWAADTFRSVDAVYIHNYVLGAQVAERAIAFLQSQFGDDTMAWGLWLADNYYADGRRRSLAEKTAAIR